MYQTNDTISPQREGDEVVHQVNHTDSQKETFKDLWEFNMKCFQEMYLDATSTQTSPSISYSSHVDRLATSTPNHLLQPSRSVGYVHPHLGGTGAAMAHNSQLELSALNFQHQQLMQQHQLAAVAQHRLALAAAAGNNQQQDEISKSLKMFAMLTAYKAGTDPSSNVPAPVDDIMQDFACNGYICDELNRYHQYQAALQNASANNFHNSVALYSSGGMNNTHRAANENPFNLNISDVRNSFWKMLPPHMQETHAAAAAAAAAAVANIDYNSNKKPQSKRFSNIKNDKYSSAKHCVFCENNNEPEAVVKSHAVRDTQGRVLCPKLRTYICPICKASGDMAHTVKYCPQKPIITMEDAIKAESFRLAKGTYYKQQMKV